MGRIPDVRMDAVSEHGASFIYEEAVMSGLSVTSGSAGVQSDLWGERAREWCAMEAQMRPLYEAVLERVGVGQGTELLDAGSGSDRATQPRRLNPCGPVSAWGRYRGPELMESPWLISDVRSGDIRTGLEGANG
jgi:hypothetical protein